MCRGAPEVNRKISDEIVAELRRFKADNPDASWKEVAEQSPIPISPKHAYRICSGQRRQQAGGPLQEPAPRPEPVRCTSCGQKHFGRPDRTCHACQVTLQSFAIRLLRESGLIPEESHEPVMKRAGGDPTPAVIARACVRLRMYRAEGESTKPVSLAG